MVKIVKRGDTYKPEKLKASILKAGAGEEIANKVVSSVNVTEEMSTLELRNQVTALLRDLDPKAAEIYKSYGEAIRLVKRGDTYKLEKLKASILKADASEEIADKVVSSVNVTEGMSTLELKNQVMAKLKELDPNAAKNYESFNKS